MAGKTTKKRKLENTETKEREKEEVLVGRESFYLDLLEKLTSKAQSKEVCSLYVCGKPGTGKTFTVSKVLSEVRKRKNLKNLFGEIIEVNGMCVASPSELWKLLDFEVSKKSLKKNFLNSLVKSLSKKKKPVVLVIDEFENLISCQNFEFVTTLLYLPFKTTNIFLVTISNLIDLPDLIMPKLERRNCIPEIILFPAYTKPEILGILQENFQKGDQVALEYCARQVEKVGDIRRALEICKNSVHKGELTFASTAKTVNSWNSTKVLEQLPQMQKTALSICKKLLSRPLTTTQLHSAYSTTCVRNGGEALPLSEFIEMLQQFCSLDLLAFYGNSSDVRKKRVAIQVTDQDLQKAFSEFNDYFEVSVCSENSWKTNI